MHIPYTHSMRPPAGLIACLLLTICLCTHTARGQYPERIGERDFILDDAELLSPDAEAQLKQLCDTLLTERKIPIMIVTIESMTAYGPFPPGTIESYARGLFDTWKIGYEDHNYGILLIVSEGDRRARIELGADFGRDYDGVCEDIMQDLIIPEFKDGDYSAGITSGVTGLDKMARGEKIPKPTFGERAQRTGNRVGNSISNGLTAIPMFCFSIPVMLLLMVARMFGGFRGGGFGGGGGGFGGGSFGGGGGGGFSGGGGASGSW